MNFKTTYVLFGILAVLLVVLGVALWYGPAGGGSTDYVFPTLHDARKEIAASDLTTVEVQRSRPIKETLVFVHDPESKKWKMTQPYDLPVDDAAVSRLVGDVYGARKEEHADLTSNLAQWGLDDPSEVVVLKKGDQEWKLNVGQQTEGESTGVVYVTSTDQPKQPMAVKKSELSTIFQGLNEFRSKELLTASALNLISVDVQKGKQDQLALVKTDVSVQLDKVDPARKADLVKVVADVTGRDQKYATDLVDNLPATVRDSLFEEDAEPIKKRLEEAGGTASLPRESKIRWRFRKPDYGEADYEGETPAAAGEPKPVTSVRELLTNIENIRVEKDADFVAVGVKDWAQYGLEPGGDYLRIEVLRRPGGLLGGDSKEAPVRDALVVGKKADDKGDKVFVRLESQDAVERVAAKNVDAIAQVAEKPEVLRDRDLVAVDQAQVDAIDVKKPDAFLKLRRADPSTWKLFLGDTKEARKADSPTVQELLNGLEQKKQILSFDPGKEADLGFDRQDAVTVSLWVHGLQTEDKKDAKPEEKKEKVPTADLKLKDEQHPTVQLTFGNRDDKTVTVRRLAGGNKTLVTLPISLFAKVNQPPLTYLDRTLTTFPETAAVTGLLLQRNGETDEIESEEKDGKPTGTWKFKQPMDLAGRPAYGRNIGAILTDLRTISTDKLVAGGFEKVSDADLEKYGLKPPQVRAVVTVKGTDNKPQTHEFLIGKETEDKGNFYAKQGENDLVFLVRPALVETLRGELQDPTVFHFSVGDVTGLSVTGWKKVQGFTITLDVERKMPQSWTLKKPEGLDLDDAKVSAFLGELADLKAERFMVRKTGATPAHKLGEADRSLQIEITVKGEKTPLTLTVGDLDAADKGYYAQGSTRPGDVFLLPQGEFEKVVNGGVKYSSKGAEAAK